MSCIHWWFGGFIGTSIIYRIITFNRKIVFLDCLSCETHFCPISALFSNIFLLAFQKKICKNKEIQRRKLNSIIDTYLKSEELIFSYIKKGSPSIFGCFDLESGRIKLSRPCVLKEVAVKRLQN